jgi:hypothetical protein
VYFLYWTAIAAPDGGVGFRSDLYGRDERLIAMLAEPSAEGRELVSVEPNATKRASGSSRVSDTLLPAPGDPRADIERATEPLASDEYGSELPPLDESTVDVAPTPQAGSTTQRDGVADAVRHANERTRFTDAGARPDASTTTEVNRFRRSWPDESTRYGRSRRITDDDRPFPLLRRLFEGPPPQDRYTRRGRP